MSVPSRDLTPEDIELIEFARQIVEDLMPLAAIWTVEGGTQDFDPALFEDPSDGRSRSAKLGQSRHVGSSC
ncbi:MAG TPA: hypothetical protein VGI58_03310 [Streptosporangiaceae bacterium]